MVIRSIGADGLTESYIFYAAHLTIDETEGDRLGSDLLQGITFSLITVVIALLLILLIERERKKPVPNKDYPLEKVEAPGLSVPVRRTITDDMYREAKDKLRILEVEREILSYAIRRLYEAAAEGKITEEERDRLALRYKEDLERIKGEIARGEYIIALNELERMQEELVKIFSDRLEELSRRIEELRTISGFAPPPERPEPTEKVQEAKEEKIETKRDEALPASADAKKRVAKPKGHIETEKTDAEKRIEQIVSQIEEVMKRLSQSEVEE
ncbi:MAG: hypothetical protein NZ952_03105 [Candidatus Bathyarchaeota archaeon]|nr:hypothetical protein [Candidatus Bathyarchaeota archaeon]